MVTFGYFGTSQRLHVLKMSYWSHTVVLKIVIPKGTISQVLCCSKLIFTLVILFGVSFLHSKLEIRAPVENFLGDITGGSLFLKLIFVSWNIFLWINVC